MEYKRTIMQKDGILTIYYQTNGWILFHKEYKDGTIEEWMER